MSNYLVPLTGSNIDLPPLNEEEQERGNNVDIKQTQTGLKIAQGFKGYKKEIDLSSPPVLESDYRPLMNYLDSTVGLVQTVYLETLGGKIDCYISYNTERVIYKNNLIRINLNLKEA